MGRPRMVTRTVKSWAVTVLCVNLETRKTFEDVVSVVGSFKTDADLKKLVAKTYTEKPNIKPVSIVGYEPKTERRYMLESDFLKLSKPMK